MPKLCITLDAHTDAERKNSWTTACARASSAPFSEVVSWRLKMGTEGKVAGSGKLGAQISDSCCSAIHEYNKPCPKLRIEEHQIGPLFTGRRESVGEHPTTISNRHCPSTSNVSPEQGRSLPCLLNDLQNMISSNAASAGQRPRPADGICVQQQTSLRLG